MSTAQPIYTRLPGRTLNLFRAASLWLAADHLLLVHETMSGEEYRRFFFRDIKGIVIMRTGRRESMGAGFYGLAVVNLMPLLMLAAQDAGSRAYAWLALGSVFWVLLAMGNILRGPTCEVRIRTAVQEDGVPPLRRLRVAHRVVPMLRTRIMEAQSRMASQPASGTAETAPA